MKIKKLNSGNYFSLKSIKRSLEKGSFFDAKKVLMPIDSKLNTLLNFYVFKVV